MNSRTLKTLVKDIAFENIWPTRCIVCDTPNTLLCKNCISKLKFIDNLKSCKKCGEPYGKIQCCNCDYINRNINSEEHVAFDKCSSVCLLDEISGKIITGFKDAGEIRLSKIIAYFITFNIKHNTNCTAQLLTYIPSTKEAIIRRGFDHCLITANEVSKKTRIKCIELFEHPDALDMRKLSRLERSKNIKGRLSVINKYKSCIKNTNILIVDDVFTTGATLKQASEVLKEYGANYVECLTFARTF